MGAFCSPEVRRSNAHGYAMGEGLAPRATARLEFRDLRTVRSF